MVSWFGRGDKKKAQAAAAPRLEVTAVARSQLAVVLGRQAEPAALRILVKNPGGAPPQYDMALEPVGAQRPGDTVLEFDGIRVFIDAESLPAVEGATVDFRNDPLQPGFLIEPPAGESVEVPDQFDTTSPLAAQVETVLEHHVNPSIAAHGGYAHLLGVKDDVVFVALGGGCQGCSMASVTLKQGIEQILKQMIPRIRQVVDATDHALGSNPFYTADKGGESPLYQSAKA
jgi:Fe/S biogenesis protein NfuA